jgi:ribulose-bisphosphate carboxylase large chain
LAERFYIDYLVTCYQGETIMDKALGIALEQSVELPQHLISADIQKEFTGQVEKIESSERHHLVTISFPIQLLADNRTQFLNVLLGNISLKPGIQVIEADWDRIEDLFPGPKFGIDGIRANMGIKERALSCTALKPVGSSTESFAEMTYQFASGGIDIIKDDHGVGNQHTSPLYERMEACVQATETAAEKTGKKAEYLPNITDRPDLMFDHFRKAEDSGAGGVLVCPHLCGLETMAQLAESDVHLPIMAHPAFSGTYVQKEQGFSHSFLFGTLWRAFGADFSIYPNAGGRFSFSEAACEGINQACHDPLTPFPRIFPTPGGGLKRETISKWLNAYGNDIVFLIGASLYDHPEGIAVASGEIYSTLLS